MDILYIQIGCVYLLAVAVTFITAILGGEKHPLIHAALWPYTWLKWMK